MIFGEKIELEVYGKYMLPGSKIQKSKYPMKVKYKTSSICRFQRTYGASHCDKLQSPHKTISTCKTHLEFLNNK